MLKSKKMTQRICKYCGDEIPLNKNKNSLYCSFECYSENKRSVAVINHRKMRNEQQLLLNDEILHDLFGIYGSQCHTPIKYLIDRSFNWDIHAGEVIINNIKAKKLIRYAYTLYINQTIQIWKL